MANDGATPSPDVPPAVALARRRAICQALLVVIGRKRRRLRDLVTAFPMPEPSAAGAARLEALNDALAGLHEAMSTCAGRVEALLREAGCVPPETREEE
jgi:hypothetical protein